MLSSTAQFINPIWKVVLRFRGLAVDWKKCSYDEKVKNNIIFKINHVTDDNVVRTVATESSIEELYICAGGHNILIIYIQCKTQNFQIVIHIDGKLVEKIFSRKHPE